MISDGSGSNPPTPEDILDFSMSAINQDRSKSFSWDKADLPIKFDRTDSSQEAFDTNFYLNGGVPQIGDIWGMMKKDNYWFNGQGDVFEANLPDGSIHGGLRGGILNSADGVHFIAVSSSITWTILSMSWL